MEDTEARVRAIIVDHLAVDRDKATSETRLCPIPDDPADNLGADSLDVVELVMAFEDEFGIEISDDESAGLNDGTVQSCVDLVSSKLTAKAA